MLMYRVYDRERIEGNVSEGQPSGLQDLLILLGATVSISPVAFALSPYRIQGRYGVNDI